MCHSARSGCACLSQALICSGLHCSSSRSCTTARSCWSRARIGRRWRRACSRARACSRGAGVRKTRVVAASVGIAHVPSQLPRDGRGGLVQPRSDRADTQTLRWQHADPLPLQQSPPARPGAPASSSPSSGRSPAGGRPPRCRPRHRSASTTHPRGQGVACVLVVPCPPLHPSGVLRRVVEPKGET